MSFLSLISIRYRCVVAAINNIKSEGSAANKIFGNELTADMPVKVMNANEGKSNQNVCSLLLILNPFAITNINNSVKAIAKKAVTRPE